MAGLAAPPAWSQPSLSGLEASPQRSLSEASTFSRTRATTSWASFLQAWAVHLPARSPFSLPPQRTASSASPAQNSSRSVAESCWPRRASAHSAAMALIRRSRSAARRRARRMSSASLAATATPSPASGRRPRLLFHQLLDGIDQVGLEPERRHALVRALAVAEGPHLGVDLDAGPVAVGGREQRVRHQSLRLDAIAHQGSTD